jgi:hypothetical protein
MDFDKRDKKASEDVGNEDAPDEKGK